VKVAVGTLDITESKRQINREVVGESNLNHELMGYAISAEDLHARLCKMHHRDVHIWQVDLADECWDMFSDVLILEEQGKTERFLALKLRQYYRRCRSALRVLLAQYSGQNAGGLRFRYGEFGKPELADHELHFNVSHSGNLGLIAISLHPVGIDLELMNPLDVNEGLINVLCHPAEKPLFECLRVNERYSLFYKLFTRKEAYCKAVGIGLQRAPSGLRFADLPGSIGSQVHDEHMDNISSSFVYDICSIIGYAASVCVPFLAARIFVFKAEPSELRFWNKSAYESR
jgi:4'-phosphopantetheinyl transferase